MDTDYETVLNTLTGDNIHLVTPLKRAIKEAESIDLIIAFLMESGVKLIIDDLIKAAERGAQINILTGRYLNITQPAALALLKDKLGRQLDLRFYQDSKPFHAKAYFFLSPEKKEMFVGSSNLSRGALTSSIEWNYRLENKNREEDLDVFHKTFKDLFNDQSEIITRKVLQQYSKGWIKSKVSSVKVEEDSKKKTEDVVKKEIFTPRKSQIEILYYLNETRLEGYNKGLVVAATGIGKTYLAAFDCKRFKAKRILFIAHRDEILNQAQEAFSNVMPNGTKIGFFKGQCKKKDAGIMLATVQTLGRDKYLSDEYFTQNSFDYIIIDEFHHAASKSYRKILSYFEPKFLLGLTATPDRLDNQDIYDLCDYNVVYEISLVEAINKGELVPFRYYGIYDHSVDYELINHNSGKYNTKDLTKFLNIHKRAQLVLRHYEKYRSKRAMGFCASKEHASYMAEYFCQNGIKAVAVHSGVMGTHGMKRKEAINQIKKGTIQVIFSVDMFNEGVDIPELDMVLFLRPTESPIIFLQQLGRGLRKHPDKEYLTVLDFIGNYKKANLIPFLLSGKSMGELNKGQSTAIKDFQYPVDCYVDFDLETIDIFKALASKKRKVTALIDEEFDRIHSLLGHVPSRDEAFYHFNGELYREMKKNKKYNIFKDYLNYLKSKDLLMDKEELLLESPLYGFVNFIENTNMSKSYKMPLLLAFYNDGNIKYELSDEDIYISFKTFYSKPSNNVDLKGQNSTKGYETWGLDKYVSLAKDQPVKALLKTSSQFFYENDKRNICLNVPEPQKSQKEIFAYHVNDAISYRTQEYYKHRSR